MASRRLVASDATRSARVGYDDGLRTRGGLRLSGTRGLIGNVQMGVLRGTVS